MDTGLDCLLMSSFLGASVPSEVRIPVPISPQCYLLDYII